MTDTDNKTRTIALDMIGVLVQEEKLISKGFPDFFGDELLLPINEIKERYDTGYCVGATTRDDFWQGVLARDWHDAEHEFLLQRRFAPDALRVVKDLAGHFDIAVISDMPREWATIILDTHGISPFLTGAVFSNDGLGNKKNGKLFDGLITTLKTTGEMIVLVDDRVHNLELAATRGIVGVCCPLGDPPESSEFPVLDDLSGLPDLLHRITS